MNETFPNRLPFKLQPVAGYAAPGLFSGWITLIHRSFLTIYPAGTVSMRATFNKENSAEGFLRILRSASAAI